MDLEDEYILKQANDLQWTYIHRVCGEIAVSRSIGLSPSPHRHLNFSSTFRPCALLCIGDIPYKGYIPGQVVNEPFAWPRDHNQVNHLPLSFSLSLITISHHSRSLQLI
jgi:hypothetical protein